MFFSNLRRTLPQSEISFELLLSFVSIIIDLYD